MTVRCSLISSGILLVAFLAVEKVTGASGMYFRKLFLLSRKSSSSASPRNSSRISDWNSCLNSIGLISVPFGCQCRKTCSKEILAVSPTLGRLVESTNYWFAERRPRVTSGRVPVPYDFPCCAHSRTHAHTFSFTSHCIANPRHTIKNISARDSPSLHHIVEEGIDAYHTRLFKSLILSRWSLQVITRR